MMIMSDLVIICDVQLIIQPIYCPCNSATW